ncbi:MAG: ChbG/HpnK family deacetylase, partial [Planctomycetes bacterium]|nr:ChbG/HpnK family deacetylase [Planctomycetota bacterium]
DAPQLGVGVHLNGCQGRPLSKEGLALANSDGVMNSTGAGAILGCLRDPRRIGAMIAEFDAQIGWVVDHGIRPTHLDSHRHIHAFTPIHTQVVALARRHGIRFLRRHGEVLAGRHWPTAPAGARQISRMLNLFAAVNAVIGNDLRGACGTWGIAHTGRIDVPWLLRAAGEVRPGVTEIMTHPGCGDDLDASATYLLASRSLEMAALCDPVVKEAFSENAVELIHYGHL